MLLFNGKKGDITKSSTSCCLNTSNIRKPIGIPEIFIPNPRKIPLKVLQNPIEIPLRSMKIHGNSMNFIHIKSTENSSFCLVPMMCRVPSSRSPPASRQGVLRRRPSSCGPDTSAACPASPRGRLGQELSRPHFFFNGAIW